jgi:hypothetical protein
MSAAVSLGKSLGGGPSSAWQSLAGRPPAIQLDVTCMSRRLLGRYAVELTP